MSKDDIKVDAEDIRARKGEIDSLISCVAHLLEPLHDASMPKSYSSGIDALMDVICQHLMEIDCDAKSIIETTEKEDGR